MAKKKSDGGVYRVTEIIGTSPTSWEEAAKNAVETAAKSLHDLRIAEAGTPVVTYCDVQGGYTGTGNININPAFVNATGGNYHLLANSLCIDTGSNAAIPPGVTADIEGNPRQVDGNCDGNAVVDMGAYERAGDLNCDGHVNEADYWYIHDGTGYCSPQQVYLDFIRADMDRDGCITLADYQWWLICYRNANGVAFVIPSPGKPELMTFIDVLLGVDTGPSDVAASDLNGDQAVDGLDIQLFVNALLQQ